MLAITLIFVAAVWIPLCAACLLARRLERVVRVSLSLVAGQVVNLPAAFWIGMQEATPVDNDAWFAALGAALLALVLSGVLTFGLELARREQGS